MQSLNTRPVLRINKQILKSRPIRCTLESPYWLRSL